MKKQVKQKQANPLIIAGIIVIILVIVLLIIIFSPWKSFNNDKGNDKEDDTTETQTDCASINLKIQELNPNFNILIIKRESGSGDLHKIRISINQEAEDLRAIGLDEGEDKQFILDINSGDEVKIAPILADGTVCDISDTQIA